MPNGAARANKETIADVHDATSAATTAIFFATATPRATAAARGAAERRAGGSRGPLPRVEHRLSARAEPGDPDPYPPIAIVLGIVENRSTTAVRTEAGTWVTSTGTSILGALFMATVLMLVFRHRYPKWWFDFALELTRFGARVGAYFALLTDEYPSTVEQQSVHLDIDYPDVERDLNRWLPLVKWFLAIPHFIVLFFLSIGAFFAVDRRLVRDPVHRRATRAGLFDFVVGVGRWALRVYAYAILLVTDQYPPFSLD